MPSSVGSHRMRMGSAALLAATAFCAPHVAFASTAREAQLEDRLAKLEAEMAQLRADLSGARQEQAARTAKAEAAVADANARTEQTAVRLAAVEARPSLAPAPALAPVEAKSPTDGFRSGNSTLNIGGYIKLVATSSHFSDGKLASNTFGRDFYLPQVIPTGNGPTSDSLDLNAKQSRFWLDVATRIGGHDARAYVEADFQTSPGVQASKRTTNGYNFTLRRAFMQFDRWTIGQDWSTFQYVSALPESTDFVGATEGTVFVRQPLIRYSLPIAQGTTLHLALEQPETGTANIGSGAIIENGDERVPDAVARLNWTGKPGELSLAVLGRQVRVQNGAAAAQTMGYGASAAGKIWLNHSRTSDFRAMLTYGHNASRYVGLNFAPDAVYDPATQKLESVDVLAALAAVRIAVAPQVRVNLIGSWQHVSYDDDLARSAIGSLSRQAWSVAANVFYSPLKNIDLGIEFRHGVYEVVNGNDGSLNRVEFAAKYSF